jgi:hypothetical protein
MSSAPIIGDASQAKAAVLRYLNRLPEFAAYFAGVVLAFVGTAEIISSFGSSESLDIKDPIFGLGFRWLMGATAIIHLTLSFLILFTKRKLLGLGLTIWIVGNFLVYRIGLWTMGWMHSSGFNFDGIGISLKATDVITVWIALFLLAASCVVCWMGNRRIQATTFLKNFCPACGGHVKFAFENEGRQIPCPHCAKPMKLRREDNLKMSCFFCHEHISFPAHAIGQKIACPHCKMDITLKEPS